MANKEQETKIIENLSYNGAKIATDAFRKFIANMSDSEIESLSHAGFTMLVYNTCSLFTFSLIMQLNESNDIKLETACANINEMSAVIVAMMEKNWDKIEQARKDKITAASSAN